ncbi:MAG: exodeoxyribonuclease V subunit alpha [Desulfobacterales bacterium]|nr:exodeoxyribonuclease V subunit alpha [Desulfobacterales bacterium]
MIQPATTDAKTESQRFFTSLVKYKILDQEDHKTFEGLHSFFRKLDLSPLDYMTIRDLLEIGEYEGDLPLAVVLMMMFAALGEGSLCLDLDSDYFFGEHPGAVKRRVAECVREFRVRAAEKDGYARLLTRNGSEYLPLILDNSRGADLLYFQKYYFHENRLKSHMAALLAAENEAEFAGDLGRDPGDGPGDGEGKGVLNEIFSPPLVIRVGDRRAPIQRDPDQVKAIQLALAVPFAIISGGPGTGKTSLMVNILRCLVRAGIPAREIVLGAPTGRAAQRMTEALRKNLASIREPSDEDRQLMELSGGTLHKILRYSRGRNDFLHGEGNPLSASAVVVDEVSMVDLVMLEKLLQAIDPARTRLIFLGDKDQLPSVEAGAVFAEMIPDRGREGVFKDRLVVLEKVHRSGANLLELAGRINQGRVPGRAPISLEDALTGEPDQWALVHAAEIDTWRDALHLWATRYYLEQPDADLPSFRDIIRAAGRMTEESLLLSEAGQETLSRIFHAVDRARILTLVREGLHGCNGINAIIANRLLPALDPRADPEAGFFSGAVIIITRNDYTKELFNGDVGVVIRDRDRNSRAYFQRPGAAVSFPVELLPPWDPAFAMTVHKSQGSEFDDVLLVLPEDETHRLLTREIVYTGVTRAKKRVIIHGAPQVLAAALKRKIQRRSGLMWRKGK